MELLWSCGVICYGAYLRYSKYICLPLVSLEYVFKDAANLCILSVVAPAVPSLRTHVDIIGGKEVWELSRGKYVVHTWNLWAKCTHSPSCICWWHEQSTDSRITAFSLALITAMAETLFMTHADRRSYTGRNNLCQAPSNTHTPRLVGSLGGGYFF